MALIAHSLERSNRFIIVPFVLVIRIDDCKKKHPVSEGRLDV
jgi:hypothetical protein